MSVDLHRQAGQLVGEADRLLTQGRREEAERLYRRAAEFEAQVFAGLSLSRPKTRGILALQTVSLYRKAGLLPEAIRYAHLYLSSPDIPEFAQRELTELLIETIRVEEAQQAGRSLASPTFMISLRGGDVRTGLAPLDTVILKLQQFQRYTYRISEWTAGLPFRPQWPPSREILEAVTPMLSEAQAGSFQFQMRLEAPLRQLSFLEPKREMPLDQVAREFFRVLETATAEDPRQMEEAVPNPDYRRLLVKLIRNLVPDGRELTAIDIQRVDLKERWKKTLTPHVREIVKKHLAGDEAKPEPEVITLGTLRAVDLDKGQIRIVEGDRSSAYRLTGDRNFDDELGPFVNRRVRVEGHWEKTRFVIDDIELYSEDTRGTQGS